MADPCQLSASEAARRIKAGRLTAEALTDSCLQRIADRDAAVGAWRHLDAGAALEQARAIDRRGPDGPLAGIPVGVKDLIDTADMPTGYGSTIYGLHQPSADAACVSRTRRAGAVIMGKTVTTEFAWRNPGKTANPHNPGHTPGGSSSGSAAAVADCQVPLAFGSQTAGSVIRPAAYCGAVGFKPSFGSYELTGVKELAPTFDTIGSFARSVEDIALFDHALRGAPPADLSRFDDRPPRFALMVPFRTDADADALAVLDRARAAASGAGAPVHDQPADSEFEAMAEVHNLIMTAEAGRALAWEYDHHPERLIRFYRESIMLGRAVGDDRLAAARARADACRQSAVAVFDRADAILTLPAPGIAPAGLGFTGDPLFNKVWTLLRWPCVSLPFATGPGGLPLGVQLVGPPGADGETLAAAAWLERALAAG